MPTMKNDNPLPLVEAVAAAVHVRVRVGSVVQARCKCNNGTRLRLDHEQAREVPSVTVSRAVNVLQPMWATPLRQPMDDADDAVAVLDGCQPF